MKLKYTWIMIFLLGITAMVPCLHADETTKTTPAVHREVAFTIDDLPFTAAHRMSIVTLKIKTAQLLNVLIKHKIPAVGFVNPVKCFPNGQRDENRAVLLNMWLDSGMELGNHTYAHKGLHKVPPKEFIEDIVKGELIVKELLEKRRLPLRYFRHPYLHTGRSLEIKKEVETFLAERGYTIAPVTIDNSDWIFAHAYHKAADAGDKDLMKRIADAFIPYMEQKFAYYEQQSLQLFGRPIKHILLLHANWLNADHLGRLVAMLKKRGYSFISLEEALKDKAYQSADTYVGPGGITWLHRWAITMGKKGEFFKDEPRTPQFVRDAADIKYE